MLSRLQLTAVWGLHQLSKHHQHDDGDCDHDEDDGDDDHYCDAENDDIDISCC